MSEATFLTGDVNTGHLLHLAEHQDVGRLTKANFGTGVPALELF